VVTPGSTSRKMHPVYDYDKNLDGTKAVQRVTWSLSCVDHRVISRVGLRRSWLKTDIYQS